MAVSNAKHTARFITVTSMKSRSNPAHDISSEIPRG
jgi:hypothetical protein